MRGLGVLSLKWDISSKYLPSREHCGDCKILLKINFQLKIITCKSALDTSFKRYPEEDFVCYSLLKTSSKRRLRGKGSDIADYDLFSPRMEYRICIPRIFLDC